MSWKIILKQELTLLIEPVKNKINSLIEEYQKTPNKPRLDPYGMLVVTKKTKRGNMLIDIKLRFDPEDKTNTEDATASFRFTKLPASDNMKWRIKPKFRIARRNGNWDSGWNRRTKYDWVDEITEELQGKIVQTINQITLMNIAQ